MSNIRHDQGFTLIELLVVISIIGLLSSIMLASLNVARSRSINSAARSTGVSLLQNVATCDLGGGKINPPNSATTPTNNFCSNDPSLGTWPKSPQGWSWSTIVWITGKSDMFDIENIPGDSDIYCGYLTDWASYCSGSLIVPALCRMSQQYSCVYYDEVTGDFE